MPQEKIRVALDLSDAIALIERQQQEIATLTKDMAKYKAFWDHSREVDRINFSRFEWQALRGEEAI